LSDEWCGGCSWRFDLNLDGTVESEAAADPLFMWQWVRVIGVDNDKIPPGCGNILLPASDEIRGMSLGGTDGSNQDDSPINLTVEVDQDLKVEEVLHFDMNRFGLITALRVMDYQEGDLDTTWNDYDGTVLGIPEPGLSPGFVMRTLMGGGNANVLEITETNAETLSRLDYNQMDQIERILQLSFDTGRYCQGGSPTNWANIPGLQGLTNPVTRCTDCGCCGTPADWDPSDPASVAKYAGSSCLDGLTWKQHCRFVCYQPGSSPTLFIRSEIKNETGYIWQSPR